MSFLTISISASPTNCVAPLTYNAKNRCMDGGSCHTLSFPGTEPMGLSRGMTCICICLHSYMHKYTCIYVYIYLDQVSVKWDTNLSCLEPSAFFLRYISHRDAKLVFWYAFSCFYAFWYLNVPVASIYIYIYIYIYIHTYIHTSTHTYMKQQIPHL